MTLALLLWWGVLLGALAPLTVVLDFRRRFVVRLVCAMNLSGRNVVLLLGDDALVRLFATKSTPPRLYVITGPLSRLWNPEKVGGPKSVGLIEERQCLPTFG